MLATQNNNAGAAKEIFPEQVGQARDQAGQTKWGGNISTPFEFAGSGERATFRNSLRKVGEST
jgi:hypothetical protein